MIRKFEDIVEEIDIFGCSEPFRQEILKQGYEVGVAEASAHFEAEKIAIHEYYHKHITEVVLGKKIKEPNEENSGKLT